MPVSYTPHSGADGALTLASFNSRYQEIEDYFLAALAAGQATQTAIEFEAGESLGDRNAGYLDLSDSKIYKMDADASGPKAGTIRGFVDGATSAGATARLVIGGVMDGFAALTIGDLIYAATTSGTITQTRPAPASEGSQIMIAEMGFAIDTDTVIVRPRPIQFQKRAAFSDNETLTVQHYGDDNGYLRNIWAYITEAEAGADLASYASSNQDADVALEGASGAGATLTITASGTTARIGDVAGVERREAQSFTIVTAGILSQFTVELDPNVGSPTGDITWEIRADNAGEPGTLLASSSFTPVANSTNTITTSGANRIFLSTTIYWLVLHTTAQGTGVGYAWQAQNTSSYAGGQIKYSDDGGSTWSALTWDAQMSVTTIALTTGAKLAQTFNLASTQTIASVGLWLRKIGSPTGTVTVRIETTSAGSPTGTLVDASATATFSESTLTTDYAEVLVTFSSSFSLASGDYAIVLSTSRASSSTNYILWGADGSAPSYSGGAMYSYAGSWSAASKDAVFAVYALGTTHPSRVSVDWWSSSHADVVNRYGDGAGADLSTKTTFKCLRDAGFTDLTVVVELP